MITGVYTLVKRKALWINNEWVPGEITGVIEKKNAIQYKLPELNLTTVVGLAPLRLNQAFVYISHIPQTGMLYGSTNNTSQWLEGDVVDPPEYTTPTSSVDGFWTLRGRYNPPASDDRYIWSVAVAAGRNTGATSCVTLDQPCVQTPAEILDVFFRLIIDRSSADAETTTAILTNTQTMVLMNSTSSNNINALSFPLWMHLYPIATDVPGHKQGVQQPWQANSGRVLLRNPAHSSATDAQWGHRLEVPLPGGAVNELLGLPFRSMGTGGSTRLVAKAPIDKGMASSVQNSYPRRADTGNFRDPFLDIDNLATSAGQVIVTDPGGDWASTVDEPFVHHYRIEIVNGGEVGTATYRLRHRRCTGWNHASYGPRPMAVTTSNPGMVDRPQHETSLTTERYGQIATTGRDVDTAYGDFRVIRDYLWPEYYTFAANGITIMHVQGHWENVDDSSSIPLPATDILQTDNDGPDILVACKDTGLWRIVRTSEGPITAITQITPAGITNPDSCRGIVVNRFNGDYWALFHDTTDSVLYLAKSTDQGANWTLYDESTDPQFLLTNWTSGSPGPSNVIGLVLNDFNSDGEIFIVAPGNLDAANDATSGQGFWWSEAGSSPTSDEVRMAVTGNGTPASALGWKRTGPLGIRPMSNGQWIVQSTTNTGIGQNAASCANIDFGTNTLLTQEFSSSARRSSIGRVGPLIYVDDSGQDYLVGTTTGIPTSTRSIVLRTPAQFGTADFTHLVYENSSAVSTSAGSTGTGGAGGRVSGELNGNDRFQGLVTHLGNGIFASKLDEGYLTYMTFYGDGRVAVENDIPWFRSYGWTGTEWEAGEAGNRTTHATDEEILDGLEVSFDDDGGSNPYVAGEYYDVYVYDGILFDNATALSQTMNQYMHLNEAGTTFTPAVVPDSNVGAVTEEKIALLRPGPALADTGLAGTGGNDPYHWGEPGIIIAGGGTTPGTSGTGGMLEHRLSGDFEFRFKMVQTSGAELRIGFVDWDTVVSLDRTIPVNNATIRFYLTYSRTGAATNGDIDYTLIARTTNMNSVASTVHTESVSGGSEDDVFAVRRVGSTITLLRNNTTFYTFASTYAQDFGILLRNIPATISGGYTLYDGEIDYTISRRYVQVGNGTTTGAADVNFRKLACNRVVGTDLRIFLDGVPATILLDGVTPPGPGEVQVLPYSGRLWFNADDEGKAITGNWRILKKLNLE